MPVTQSAIMKFPLPGAALTDNRIADMVAIIEALLALDNKWDAFKKIDSLKPGIISVDSDKLVYQINEQIVVTITTKNILNNPSAFNINYKLIPGTYYDVSGFSVGGQGLNNISDNVYQITYAFYNSDTVNVFENFTFKLEVIFNLNGTDSPIKYSNDVTITANAIILDDYSQDLSTTGRVTDGGSITGVLEKVGDRDWFAVDLEADKTYHITLADSTFAADTYLRILDSSGVELNSDDDGGPDATSALDFTPTVTGTYYISAEAYDDNSKFSYNVTVASVAIAYPKLNWVDRDMPERFFTYCLTFGNGEFVAGSTVEIIDNLDGTFSRHYYTFKSNNGIDWVEHEVFGLGYIQQHIAYGNGIFISPPFHGSSATSTDGVNWNVTDCRADIDCGGVTFGNGVFVAVFRIVDGSYLDGHYRIGISSDGVNWVDGEIINARGIIFGNGVFVTNGFPGDSSRACSHSTDGINWTSVNTNSGGWGTNNVAFGNGLFITNGQVSYDGIVWSDPIDYAPGADFLAYGNGILVGLPYAYRTFKTASY